MQQLSRQDAMFVHMEMPNTPLQIGFLNVYNPAAAPGGKVGFKAILDHIEQRLHTVHFFRQRIVRAPVNLDSPYWIEDETFDLERHVKHVRLPAPGDWRQLCIHAARLFAQSLVFAKPLWEFTVIEGLDKVEGFPPGSFAMLTKMHHAAVDGVSGWTSPLTSTPPCPTPRRPSRVRGRPSRPRARSSCWRAATWCGQRTQAKQ